MMRFATLDRPQWANLATLFFHVTAALFFLCGAWLLYVTFHHVKSYNREHLYALLVLTAFCFWAQTRAITMLQNRRSGSPAAFAGIFASVAVGGYVTSIALEELPQLWLASLFGMVPADPFLSRPLQALVMKRYELFFTYTNVSSLIFLAFLSWTAWRFFALSPGVHAYFGSPAAQADSPFPRFMRSLLPVPVRGWLLLVVIYCFYSIASTLVLKIAFPGPGVREVIAVLAAEMGTATVANYLVMHYSHDAAFILLPCIALYLVQKRPDIVSQGLKTCLGLWAAHRVYRFVFDCILPSFVAPSLYDNPEFIAATVATSLKFCLTLVLVIYTYRHLTPVRCASDYQWGRVGE